MGCPVWGARARECEHLGAEARTSLGGFSGARDRVGSRGSGRGHPSPCPPHPASPFPQEQRPGQRMVRGGRGVGACVAKGLPGDGSLVLVPQGGAASLSSFGVNRAGTPGRAPKREGDLREHPCLIASEAARTNLSSAPISRTPRVLLSRRPVHLPLRGLQGFKGFSALGGVTLASQQPREVGLARPGPAKRLTGPESPSEYQGWAWT